MTKLFDSIVSLCFVTAIVSILLYGANQSKPRPSWALSKGLSETATELLGLHQPDPDLLHGEIRTIKGFPYWCLPGETDRSNCIGLSAMFGGWSPYKVDCLGPSCVVAIRDDDPHAGTLAGRKKELSHLLTQLWTGKGSGSLNRASLIAQEWAEDLTEIK
ncbi:hypothetical protein [Ferrimonas marina]|uniref:Uncharacterized protein n=1 Tax=Ferrimonas marina TaxID=299255 RepID=A0A1M5UFB7_9GAMM|nr:hypothetical protein [Ferrimonas marina]SHH61732.1 hypothetical protein SAMN02745129_2545 [Ferrimonas marina]